MRDERFRRFRPFRDFARSRKAETALAARFFSRFRDFDGKLRFGAAESAEVSPPRRSGAILRAVVTVRCPAKTLVLGRR